MTREKKRTLYRLIAVITALLIAVLSGSTAVYAWAVDTRYQSLTLSNVPEGTAFADILVKDKNGDEYAVDFNEENAGLLGVDRDCGLAAYDTDGYTSLLLRHNCAVFREVRHSEQIDESFILNADNSELFNRYHHIKVAYCGKNGNILGVTDEVKVKYVLFDMPAYDIQADGQSLSCRVETGPPYYLLVLISLGLILLIAVIAVSIAVKLIKKAQTERMIKRIQSGEVENEREEQ